MEATGNIRENNSGPLSKLNDHELDVLKCIREGRSYVYISSLTGFSVNSIRRMWKNVCRKLRIDNRIEAAVLYERYSKDFNFKVKKPDITERSFEYLKYIHAGLTNPEIADKMNITKETARCYVKRMLKQLGYSSRIKLAADAEKFSWLREEE